MRPSFEEEFEKNEQLLKKWNRNVLIIAGIIVVMVFLMSIYS